MANFFKELKNKLFGAFKKNKRSASKKEKSFSLSNDSVNFVSLKGMVLSYPVVTALYNTHINSLFIIIVYQTVIKYLTFTKW